MKSRKSKRLIEAKCKRTSEGFVVLKGSKIEEFDYQSIPKSIADLRSRCKASGEIVDGKLRKEYLFNSPSAAASFIMGGSVNGRAAWKNKEGIALKELEEREI